MFTIPVGNFKQIVTGYRPTAGIGTITGDGAVANVANAYDGDPDTYCASTSATGTTETIYSGFNALVASSGASLQVTLEAGSIGFQVNVDVSFDGGANYLFPLPISTSIVGPSTIANKQVCTIAVPNGIFLSSVKVRTKTLSDPSGVYLYVYDIVINQ